MMLLNNEKTDFFHKRNALRDVWFGSETSKNFPPAVWYYLNYSSPENGIATSLREQIIQKWKSFGQISKSTEKEMLDLYFGEGGEYTSEQLENRADMYDQLESNINLINETRFKSIVIGNREIIKSFWEYFIFKFRMD